MFLIFRYYGERSFDITYIKDDDHQTLQSALDIIGGYHDLYLSDNYEVYNKDEMNEEDLKNVYESRIHTIGCINVFDEQFLSIEGEIQ